MPPRSKRTAPSGGKQPKLKQPPQQQPKIKRTKLDQTNLKPSQTLYIKNLNDKINHRQLKHNLYLLFSTYGDIIQIRLAKGHAHILFANVSLASLALRSLQQEEFFDKPLMINYSTNESKLITKLKGETKTEDKSENGDGDEEELPHYEED